ncbi:MAG: hypothetical protein KGR26_11600, partial [Cyanobacteria bacterium REEB65]|nr:hypothetical protein [Cyanobacteria bacterium REEB65]
MHKWRRRSGLVAALSAMGLMACADAGTTDFTPIRVAGSHASPSASNSTATGTKNLGGNVDPSGSSPTPSPTASPGPTPSPSPTACQGV